NLATSDPAFRSVLGAADLVLADGIGMDLYGRLAGRRFPYDFNGTDAFPRLFGELSAEKVPLRVFLYGAKPGRAGAAARRIESSFATVRVVGVVDGYGDESRVVELVNAARPQLVLVAKGNPLQESWIHRHAPSLDAGVAAGVGALFDFLSG